MANFKTHLTTAAALSGIAATSLLGAGIAGSGDVLLYFTAGTIGGLLPDLDSDNSIILRIMFAVFSVFLSFLLMFTQSRILSTAELLILWGIFYVGISYGVFNIFSKYTVHRGLFHSIPAAAFAWMLTTNFAYQFLNYSSIVSWSTGFFIFLGYIIHLVLDEIYSVDLDNKKIKKSFGTALKLLDPKNTILSIALYLAVFGGYYIAPNPTRFMEIVFKENVVTNLKQNFLPRGGWFRKLR